MAKPRGFTLTQLVLTIAAVGIMALAAVVSVPNTNVARLDTAAKQVASDIQFARQNAMMTKQTSGVVFNSGGTYTVYQGTVATPLPSPLTRQNMVILLSTQYPNISITSNYTVAFDGTGSPTTGPGGNVTLSDGTTTRTITVTANTGKVTIQ